MVNLFLWVVVLPFCMWVWWGIAFVTARTLIAIVTLKVTEELKMTEVLKRDRLIRYAAVATKDKPNLLSKYDADKNLLIIDYDLVIGLPTSMANHLETTELAETMIIDDGMGVRFGVWKAPA